MKTIGDIPKESPYLKTRRASEHFSRCPPTPPPYPTAALISSSRLQDLNLASSPDPAYQITILRSSRLPDLNLAVVGAAVERLPRLVARDGAHKGAVPEERGAVIGLEVPQLDLVRVRVGARARVRLGLGLGLGFRVRASAKGEG